MTQLAGHRTIPAWQSSGRAGHGVLKVLTAASLMGTLGPVAAIAYDNGMQPATLSALRAAMGAAILGVLVATHRQPSIALGRLVLGQRVRLTLAVIANGLMNLCLFIAFGAMAVGVVMVVYYTYPALVALLSAALRRERLTLVRVLALAVVSAGLALVLGSQVGPDAHATPVGLALAGAAAACHAIYLVVIRSGFDDVPGVQATSLVLAGGALISGTAAILFHGLGAAGAWLASPVVWVAIALAGTVGAVPKVWVIGGVRLIGSTRAAIAMTVEPVVAVVVASLALGQQLSAQELVGAAAILAAVVLVQAPPGRSPAPVAADAG